MQYIQYCGQFNLNLLLWVVCVCVHGEEKVCVLQCRCEANKMTCVDGIPVTVPKGVTTLTLGGLDLDNDTFEKDPAYSGITSLTIFASAGRAISENYFDSFTNLQYLGIHGDQLRTIDISSFVGLDNLTALNMSSNPYLNIDYISEAIDRENRKVLPKLETLSVAYISTLLTTPINLNENFYRSLTTYRTVRYLDISGVNIAVINFPVFYKYACNSIESFIAANAVISNIEIDYFVSFVTCTSLKTLDLSGVVIPATRTKFSFKIYNFFCFALTFFYNIEYLMLGNINTQEYLTIDNYTLTMQGCPLKFRKVIFANNKVKWVNMTVTLHEITTESFEELDASFNAVEYISPSVMKPSVNIKILDLSNNKLGTMEKNYKGDFENLFSAQCKLETLNISNNGLVNIPEYTFRNNTMLRYLDISFNLIETLSFYVKHLIHLEELIAVNNRMKTISLDFMSNTQWLFVKMMNIRNISVHGNSFKCTCTKESQAITEWLSSGRFIDKSMPLFCELDGRKVNILTTAVGDTKQYCTIQELQTIAAFVGPSLVVVLIIILAVSVLLVRKRRRERAFKAVVALVENGNFPMNYLAFLSSSSEDTTPVMTHIYPKLSAMLSEMVHSQKEHVCLGDRHFRPGFSLRCELIRCISESSVFIAVISGKFCEKPWCNEEFKEAYDQNKPIILIMLDHVDQNIMHPFIKKIFNKNAHASWIPDEHGGHLEPNWNLFCKSVLELAGTNI